MIICYVLKSWAESKMFSDSWIWCWWEHCNLFVKDNYVEVITLSELISFPRKNMECKHIKFHRMSNVTDDSSMITKEDKIGVRRERESWMPGWLDKHFYYSISKTTYGNRERFPSIHRTSSIRRKQAREKGKKGEGSRREWRCLHNKCYYCGL